MIKNVWVLHIEGNPVESERYYLRYHTKEVTRALGPWLRRYETYRAYEAPPDAQRFDVVSGRLTELWYYNVDEMMEARSRRPAFTRPGPGVYPPNRHRATCWTPAIPTEDFLMKEPTPEERPILRWYQVFRYPDGVSAADGDAWYLRHAEEVKSQEGLLRFVSHRVLEGRPFGEPRWSRVSELWYEDFDAWRKAISGAGEYTPPPWGGTFPFVEMVSTFVGYKPDVDCLRDNPTIP